MAKDYHQNDGYFYVQIKPKTFTAVIKRLNSHFEITGKSKLNHSKLYGFNFNSYSTQFGSFTVCRYYNLRNSLKCSLLDTELSNTKLNVELNYFFGDTDLKKYGTLNHINVMNTLDNGFILTFAVKFNFFISKTPIYVQKIERDGKNTDPVLLGEISCEIYNLQNFYVANNVYCIVVVCDEEVHTRCIKNF